MQRLDRAYDQHAEHSRPRKTGDRPEPGQCHQGSRARMTLELPLLAPTRTSLDAVFLPLAGGLADISQQLLHGRGDEHAP